MDHPRSAGEGGEPRLPARYASFRVRDAYQPQPVELLLQLAGDLILQGRVEAVSDNGEPGGAFVMLDVESCGRTVVVPISRVIDWCDG